MMLNRLWDAVLSNARLGSNKKAIRVLPHSVLCVIMLATAMPVGGIFMAQADAATYYLAPTGSDGNAGTSATAPWRTFAHAIPKLRPGDTLLLRHGTYTRATSGYPTIICGRNAVSGTASQRITLKAENERQAFLKGDGSAYPFSMQSCAYWTIEGLRAEQGDFSSSTLGRGAVFKIGQSNNLILRRNLLRFNNRYKNGSIFEVHNSSNSLIEENEIYSFHRHGYDSHRSTGLIFRRNYANSRGRADIAGGFSSAFDKTRGEGAHTFYPASGNVVENGISEGNVAGVLLLASGGSGSSNNRTYGAISLNDRYGFLSVAGSTTTAVMDNNRAQDFVVVTPNVGFSARSSKNTRCDNCTVIGASGTGFGIDKRTDTPADGRYSFFGTNMLAVNNGGSGISIDSDIQTWTIDYVDAYANRTNYKPSSSSRYSYQHASNPQLGACKVFIPESSPMKRAGKNGKDIGGNVLYRYQNGVLTNQPLWNPTTGKFSCGAIVAGVNDIAGASCFDVHKRLNVHANGCTLPTGYGQYVGTASPKNLRLLDAW